MRATLGILRHLRAYSIFHYTIIELIFSLNHIQSKKSVARSHHVLHVASDAIELLVTAATSFFSFEFQVVYLYQNKSK